MLAYAAGPGFGLPLPPAGFLTRFAKKLARAWFWGGLSLPAPAPAAGVAEDDGGEESGPGVDSGELPRLPAEAERSASRSCVDCVSCCSSKTSRVSRAGIYL